MSAIKVPDGISVKDFFLNFVPQQFKEQQGAVDLSVMQGKEFTLQFDVDGQKFGIRVKDGKDMEVVEGGLPKPMIEVTVPETVWRYFISGGVGAGMDLTGGGNVTPSDLLRRYEKLQTTTGKINMEIKNDDGNTIPVSMVFNGTPEPAAAMKIGLADFIAMQQKKVDGPTLFMTGKLSIDGDMLFLMNLQSLM